MNRDVLIKKLELVSPALAIKDVVQQLMCFWFTGTDVMAYNDQIAISTPCKTDFKGAVPRTLLGLLNTIRLKDKEVELTEVDGSLNVRAGKRTKIKLPILPPDRFIFTMPKMGTKAREMKEADKSSLLESIDGCMRSIGSGSVAYAQDMMGLTIIPNGANVELYTTNARTISTTKLKAANVPCQQRVLLSGAFCKQMLSLGETALKVRFETTKDYALMQTDNAMLYGRLLISDKPYDFAKVLSQNYSAKDRKQMAPVPKGMKSALERATVIAGNVSFTGRSASTTLTATGKTLKIDSKSDFGNVDDSLAFKTEYDAKADFSPELLLEGMGKFSQLLVSDKCCVMTNDKGEIYLIAAGGS